MAISLTHSDALPLHEWFREVNERTPPAPIDSSRNLARRARDPCSFKDSLLNHQSDLPHHLTSWHFSTVLVPSPMCCFLFQPYNPSVVQCLLLAVLCWPGSKAQRLVKAKSIGFCSAEATSDRRRTYQRCSTTLKLFWTHLKNARVPGICRSVPRILVILAVACFSPAQLYRSILDQSNL